MIEPAAPPLGRAGSVAHATTPLVTFIILGVPAGAIGVAWPGMRASLGAPLAGLGLLLAAVTAGYFVASAISGPLTKRQGTAYLLAVGCGLAALSLFGQSLAQSWWLVPPIGFLVGVGAGFIDATVNAYVSLNRGVRYMGWLHASWAVGAALGPQVVVFSLAATGSWRGAFAATAAAFLAVGVVVAIRRQDWRPSGGATTDTTPTTAAASRGSRRALIFLMGFFLLGAGLEATAGDWAYTELTGGRSMSTALAGLGASLFWAGLAGGRVVLGLLGDRAAPTRMLDASVGTATTAALTFWLGPPLVAAFVGLPLLGFAVSIVFPLLLSLTPARVGTTVTSNAVGYQIAAGTLGGGGLPAAVGIVLQAFGLGTLGPLLVTMAAVMVLVHLASRTPPSP